MEKVQSKGEKNTRIVFSHRMRVELKEHTNLILNTRLEGCSQPASQQQRWRSNGEMKVSRGFSLKQRRVCFSEAGRIHFTWSRTSLSNFHSMTFVYFSLKFSSFLHLALLLPPQWQLFCVHSLSHSVLKSAIISFTCPDHEQSRAEDLALGVLFVGLVRNLFLVLLLKCQPMKSFIITLQQKLHCEE